MKKLDEEQLTAVDKLLALQFNYDDKHMQALYWQDQGDNAMELTCLRERDEFKQQIRKIKAELGLEE